MRGLALFAATLTLAAMAWPAVGQAQDGRLTVELNKFETIEAGCRTFFLFRNGSSTGFQGFEMSLAVFDQEGVIDRLLKVEAAPLPAVRTTLKLYEIPDLRCEEVGEILLHEIARCEPEGGGTLDCFAVVDLASRAPAALVK